MELYAEYLQSRDSGLERKILLHNDDDVLQLTRLMKVIRKCDFPKAMYHLGFPVGSGENMMQVTGIDMKREQLMVKGIQGRNAVEFRCYEFKGYPLQASFDREERNFHLSIPLNCQQGIAAVDLQRLGLDEKEFEQYPGSGSGYLVLREGDRVHYLQAAHFIRMIIREICCSEE